MKLITLLLILISLPLMFTACEEEETDTIERAQACLDQSTAGTADACLAILGTLVSSEAYAIRCSARFITAGVTATRMAGAFDKKDDNDTAAQDPLLGMMGSIAFSTEAIANSAYSECSQSGYGTYKMFAGMARTATVIKAAGSLLSTAEPTQAEMEGALLTMCGSASNCDGATTAQKEAVGETVVQMSGDYCTDNPTQAVCADVATAIASGASTEAIGELFLESLQQGS